MKHLITIITLATLALSTKACAPNTYSSGLFGGETVKASGSM